MKKLVALIMFFIASIGPVCGRAETAEDRIKRLEERIARLEERLAIWENRMMAEPKKIEIAIMGAVRTQGLFVFPYDATVTLAHLIVRAGGLTDIAKGNDIRITRLTPGGTGKKVIYVQGVEDLIKGKDTTQGVFILEAGDIVYVPEEILPPK
jgi:hypothetical protein